MPNRPAGKLPKGGAGEEKKKIEGRKYGKKERKKRKKKCDKK